jgi:release factor glutamine methyltransferase
VVIDVGEALAEATRMLRRARSASPRLDAELLLGRVLGCERAALLAHPERQLRPEEAGKLEALVARRSRAEPMAYILGEREFYGRVFKVDRRALIPRPETELLVEIGTAAVDRFRGIGVEPRVLEVGTGSGAVAVSLAAERDLTIYATDVSLEALTLARENAVHLGQSHRVKLVATDLLDGLRRGWHVIVANLPYVPRDRVLPADVKDYEPHVALFGGPSGIELIQRLLHAAKPWLEPRAEIAVELDEEDQAARVTAVAREIYPEANVRVLQDAGGYDRVVRVLL